MRVALVHELLTMRGGAERVLRIFADMFPDAPIYTLLYDEKKLGDWFPRERIKVGLNSRDKNHHHHLSKFPKIVESWDFSDYDLVLSSSSAFIHGIITNGSPKHICYVHSPARYLWDQTQDVIKRASEGPLGFLKKTYLERTFHHLRLWDSEVAHRPDKIIVPSKEVQRRCELYWRRGSEVVHPPIDDSWFEDNELTSKRANEPTFLIVSSLVRYKQIDLAIEACNKLSLNLKIVGEGPDEKRLRSIAGPTIEFLGYKNHNDLKLLYKNATATIFPGTEDFGLVPLESMACGTPVIALKRGGALETVVEGKTGAFFTEPSVNSLSETLTTFDPSNFNQDHCRSHASKFRRKQFEDTIRATILEG